MKPFNLEAALNGAKVITKKGEQVTQLVKFDTDNDERCLVGVVSGLLKSWYEDGKYSCGDRDADLFMAANTKCIWVARYVDGIHWFARYETRELCQASNPDAEGYHKLEWEE